MESQNQLSTVLYERLNNAYMLILEETILNMSKKSKSRWLFKDE
jgi:hypothetical protein